MLHGQEHQVVGEHSDEKTARKAVGQLVAKKFHAARVLELRLDVANGLCEATRHIRGARHRRRARARRRGAANDLDGHGHYMLGICLYANIDLRHGKMMVR